MSLALLYINVMTFRKELPASLSLPHGLFFYPHTNPARTHSRVLVDVLSVAHQEDLWIFSGQFCIM